MSYTKDNKEHYEQIEMKNFINNTKINKNNKSCCIFIASEIKKFHLLYLC